MLYLDRDFNVQEQPAEVIILACSTIDTPRLALLSANAQHPNGLGNNQSGMVGQNLTTHHNPTAVVSITDGTHSWDTYRGAWNTISLDDFQDLSNLNIPGNPIFPRAGVISTSGNSPGYPFGSGGPISLAVSLMKPPGFNQGGGNLFSQPGVWGGGVVPPDFGLPGQVGGTVLQAMAGAWGAEAFVLAVCEDLPQASNHVDLDRAIKDVYGQPVARITYANHPNDIVVGTYIADQLTGIGEAMLTAIGAVGVVLSTPTPITSYAVGPRYVVHQHGTMRMGSDPKTSVVNRCGQFWDIPNLFVADGSLFPTAGGYNPTHTIEALAHSVASCIVENGANLLVHKPALTPVTSLPNTNTAGGAASVGVVAGAAAVTAGLAAKAASTRDSRQEPRPQDSSTP